VKRIGTKADQGSAEVSAFLNDLSERLAASARQVDVQTHLINDLLDVSRITSNTLKLELEHCDLVPIVREAIEDMRVTAPERLSPNSRERSGWRVLLEKVPPSGLPCPLSHEGEKR
jgi:hypothetical protein